MQSIVAKFGGTSVKDSNAMLRSAQVAIDHGARIIVVSATANTTNQLIQLCGQAQSGDWNTCESVLNQLSDRHHQIADELKLTNELKTMLIDLLEELRTLSKGVSLLKECSDKARDSIISLGERISSCLFTQAYNNLSKAKQSICFDIRKVMKTDDRFGKASPLLDETRQLAQELMMDLSVVYVTQGYIGSNMSGFTTTLGRGGSDYSASLIGEAVSADLIQIWTDMAGIATTDPRICPEAKPIEKISFREAEELAIFGAKILHPAMLLPAKRAGISVFVGSSFESEKRGTQVVEYDADKPLIRAMAIKENQTLLTLSTPKMFNTYGFMARIFEVFKKLKISVDAITTSEISVALTLEEASSSLDNLIDELSEFAEIKTEKNQTLVSIIGNNINYESGIAKEVFTALGDINVRMICQGASLHNFCFLVGGKDGHDALKRLHHHFITSSKPILAYG